MGIFLVKKSAVFVSRISALVIFLKVETRRDGMKGGRNDYTRKCNEPSSCEP